MEEPLAFRLSFIGAFILPSSRVTPPISEILRRYSHDRASVIAFLSRAKHLHTMKHRLLRVIT